MSTINFILKDGSTHTIDAKDGVSVMENAIFGNIRGIEAECGGSCVCATCHVYVADEFLARIPAPDEMEDEMLDGVAAERKPNSRLSCQITMSAELDGITVQVPERQS